jgi:hypothetical protein
LAILASQGQRPLRCFDKRRPCSEIEPAAELFIGAFQGCSKNLFTLKWPFRGARNAGSAGVNVPLQLSVLSPRDRTFFVTHMSQLLDRSLQILGLHVLDHGVVGEPNRFVFVKPE